MAARQVLILYTVADPVLSSQTVWAIFRDQQLLEVTTTQLRLHTTLICHVSMSAGSPTWPHLVLHKAAITALTGEALLILRAGAMLLLPSSSTLPLQPC